MQTHTSIVSKGVTPDEEDESPFVGVLKVETA
jgi:hypothetical protein